MDFQCEDEGIRGIAFDYALHGEYEPETTKLINDIINEGDICLDAGASMGYFTLLMAKKAQKVYAFEATENQIPYLKHNVEVNELVIETTSIDTKEGLESETKNPDNIENQDYEQELIKQLDDYNKPQEQNIEKKEDQHIVLDIF